MAYASYTGTLRTQAALRAAGWGLMVSAAKRRHQQGFARWCIDNGAWTAHQNGTPFDAAAFLTVYEKLGRGADFVVLPDIVGGGLRSLEMSLSWRERLGDPLCPLLLAVQDGMSVADVAELVGPALGIFVGGTTHFKEHTLPMWGALARAGGAHLHVGRVNTARRVHLCHMAGADSIDGSSVSRFVVTLPRMDNAIRQWVLPCM